MRPVIKCVQNIVIDSHLFTPEVRLAIFDQGKPIMIQTWPPCCWGGRMLQGKSHHPCHHETPGARDYTHGPPGREWHDQQDRGDCLLAWDLYWCYKDQGELFDVCEWCPLSTCRQPSSTTHSILPCGWWLLQPCGSELPTPGGQVLRMAKTWCELLGMMLGQILKKIIIHNSLKRVQILFVLGLGDLNPY